MFDTFDRYYFYLSTITQEILNKERYLTFHSHLHGFNLKTDQLCFLPKEIDG